MPSGYYRFPTIHRDTVVFVSEDDLWTVSAQGGIARRLTSNLGEVSRPMLSPDGTQLAFVGRDEGHAEVYMMPALGGPARRLTFMGGSICQTVGWTRDGRIIFANNAAQPFPSLVHLYTIDAQGQPPQRINIGPARTIAYGPDGASVIGRNTTEPARWKRYRGGTAGQIWIDAEGDGQYRPLVQLGGNLTAPLWVNERIYFISDHEGISNLYSCRPVGDDVRRHTHHEDFYARNPSTDGKRIVYHAGAELYLFDPVTERSQHIAAEHHSSQTQRNRKFVDAARYLGDWALHPKGQQMAVTSRGKLFTFANWEGAVTQHGLNANAQDGSTTASPRYRLADWLNDGKRLIAVTEVDGEETFVIIQTQGVNAHEKIEYFSGLDIGRPVALAVNPRKDQIVFSNHRYELMVLDLQTRTLKLIDSGKAERIGGFDWSPDGAWVAYSISVSLQVMALKLWRAESGEIFPLTQPVLRDVAPAFDTEGKYIFFLSYRHFDPVYDNLHFDLNFPRGMKPYLITLQKDLPSPFVPKPPSDDKDDKKTEKDEKKEKKENKDGKKAAQPGKDEKKEEPKNGADKKPSGSDEASGAEPSAAAANDDQSTPDKASEDKKEQPTSGKSNEDKAEKPLQIDLDGIAQRVLAFPIEEGLYGRIVGIKGHALYTRYPVEGALTQNFFPGNTAPGKGALFAYDFEEQREDFLVGGLNSFDLSADHNTLIYRSGPRVRVLKAGVKPDERENNGATRKSGWLDLSRLKVSVEPALEWRQMYREAWRLQRDQFWTSDMSQVDWLAIYERYRPLVERICTRSEFSDLMWEMQGELGTSHAYEFGGDYRPEPAYQLGHLGADFAFDETTQTWRVAHIVQGDAWDERRSSPLAAAGVNAQVGDQLLAIGGRVPSRTLSPLAHLVNLDEEEIVLTLKRGEATPHQITVKTLGDETAARYREWVEKNRRYVHEQTQGRVGYVHIPDMGARGYAEFHRGYLAEIDREGLLVDLRYNGGGHVSPLILEKLARRRIGYSVSRWGDAPNPYPRESVLGAMVALTNEHAGSDGDIFSHGFKLMKLGPLLGKRTWGGVVGISPRHTLVDGTVTTQPEFSFWFEDVGWGIENYGTDPDIEVDNTPQDYAAGKDVQLDRAIAEVTKLLAANPPQLPKFDGRPSKALPRLPKN